MNLTHATHLQGRAAELERLLRLCGADTKPVTWMHGPAGIGKTSLLREFAQRASEHGATVVALDCRAIEPTPEAFLLAIVDQLSIASAAIEAIAQKLSGPGPAIVVVDTYELFLLVDAWIRHSFAPAMPSNVRLILCSRYAPGAGWTLPVEWQGLFQTFPVVPLTGEHALRMIEAGGVLGADAERMYRLTGGIPLAIRIALSARAARPEADFAGMAAQAVVHQLAHWYLSDVAGAATRRAVEAASVVRRTTRPLLAAMLPDSDGADLYERLSRLPFVEVTPEGLRLQDAVQESVAMALRAADPVRFDGFRRAALRQIRGDMRAASRETMWRYTADMLYLVRTPFIREAFFPAGAPAPIVEPARTHDGPEILAIAETHESREAAGALAAWWRRAPECFLVMRDGTGKVDGFYILLELRRHGALIPEADRLALNWRRHVRENPMARNERTIFVRRWLSASSGDRPSPAQAACWLDVKRTFLQLQPHIRRCYITLVDQEPYAAAVRQLDLAVVQGEEAVFDGVAHRLVLLDFGPGSINGWLANVVARELRLDADCILDLEARELVLETGRTPLTALELGVFRYLSEHEGAAVTRAKLLEKVWGVRHSGASNVVDVVVKTLRRKLGERAAMIATVRGVGYRLRPEA